MDRSETTPQAAEHDRECPACERFRRQAPQPVAFSLVPAHGDGWHQWGASLLRLLQRHGHGPTQVIVIEQPDVTDRYVQLLIGHGVCHAEASSNVYLRGESRLTRDHHTLLGHLGWRPPRSHRDDHDGLPVNWMLPLVHDDWQEVTEVLLATIAGIFGFEEDRRIDIQSFLADHPCVDCFPDVPE
jgi:hypothetical protein